MCKANTRCMILSDAEGVKLWILLMTPDRGLPKATVSCPFEWWRLTNLSFSPCTLPKDFFSRADNNSLAFMLCLNEAEWAPAVRWKKAKWDERYPWEVSLQLHRSVCCRVSVITAKEGSGRAPWCLLHEGQGLMGTGYLYLPGKTDLVKKSKCNLRKFDFFWMGKIYMSWRQVYNKINRIYYSC